MIPITAPADKRFLRSRVQPVRRRTWLRAVVVAVRAIVVVSVALFAVYRITVALTTAEMLRINRITPHGLQRLSRSEALSLLDGLRGQNIFLADLEQARRSLQRSPWVADAVLRKRLPSSIDVLVTERRPMGIARLNGQLYLVDDGGRRFDRYGPKYAEFDLPMIDGLAEAADGQIDQRRIDLASRVVMSLGGHPDVARRVSQIDVTDSRDAVVLLDSDTARLHLGDRQFLERLEGYLDLAPRVHERVAAVDYVDLRYGTSVFVKGSRKAESR